MRLPSRFLAPALALFAASIGLGAAPTTAPAPSITTSHGDGFTPSRLQLDRAARLGPGRILILHPGTADTIGAATHMKAVNVGSAWATRFRWTAAGGSFVFHLHNQNGFRNSYAYGFEADKLGTHLAGYLALVFRVDSGASTFGLKLGRYQGLPHASPAYTPDPGGPAGGPDFTLGHDFSAELRWNPPRPEGAKNGSARLILKDLTNLSEWNGTYTGLPAIPPTFRLAGNEPDGTRVYAGFAAMTGPTARPPVVLKSWAWGDPDGPAPAVHATASLTVDTPGEYSAGVYSRGKLKSLLMGLTPLDPGEYLIRSDGLDDLGNPLPAGCEFRAIRSASVATSRLIGQRPGVDPVKNWTLMGGLANQGVEASPDGSTCIAFTFDQDSVGQAGRFLMRGATGLADDFQKDFGQYTGCGQDAAYLDNGRVLYLWTYDFHNKMEYNVAPKVIDFRTTSPGFTGAVGHVNPDGSRLAMIGLTRETVCLVFSAGEDGRYHLVPRLAAGASTFAVAVKFAHYGAAQQ